MTLHCSYDKDENLSWEIYFLPASPNSPCPLRFQSSHTLLSWKVKVKVKSLSRVWLFTTPWTAAYQAPPSMGFSSQEYWSGGCHCLLRLIVWDSIKILNTSILDIKPWCVLYYYYYLFFILLYNTVLVLPYIDMNTAVITFIRDYLLLKWNVCSF